MQQQRMMYSRKEDDRPRYERGNDRGPKVLLPKPHYQCPPKVSHQLFIKNIPFDLPTDELQNIFAQYGELANFTRRKTDYGMAFCTYFDIRCATRALETLNRNQVGGRYLQISYSYKPPKYSGIDPRSTCGRLVITRELPISQNEISGEDLRNYFTKFGEISSLNEMPDRSFAVEYFDFRVAHTISSQGPFKIGDQSFRGDVTPEEEPVIMIQPGEPGFDMHEQRRNDHHSEGRRDRDRYDHKQNSNYHPRYNSQYPPNGYPPNSHMPYPPQYDNRPPSYRTQSGGVPYPPAGGGQNMQYPPQYHSQSQSPLPPNIPPNQMGFHPPPPPNFNKSSPSPMQQQGGFQPPPYGGQYPPPPNYPPNSPIGYPNAFPPNFPPYPQQPPPQQMPPPPISPTPPSQPVQEEPPQVILQPKPFQPPAPLPTTSIIGPKPISLDDEGPTQYLKQLQALLSE